MGNKLIIYIRDGFGWVPISLLPAPYPFFEIGENSSLYTDTVKARKTHQFEFGSNGYAQIWAHA